MATLKLRRGNSAQLASLELDAGEPAFVLDTGELYIGNGTTKVKIGGSGTDATLGTAASKNTGTTSGTIPLIESNGKLPTGIMPSLTITDTHVVATQAAMLALTAEVGDICVRTDLNKNFVLQKSGASTLGNWIELLTPPNSVTSVAGRTGVVTLTKDDVGLSNVTNESKATMLTSPAITGVPTAPTASVGTNTTQLATTSFVKATVDAKTTIAESTVATKLKAAFTLSLTGAVTGSVSIDGSGNASVATTLAVDIDGGTF